MRELVPVIQAMLKDDEFLAGGIFTKEKYYMEKYNLTYEQMYNIQTYLYYALHVRDEYFNNQASKLGKL